ncbi:MULTISPECIES: hypothetical protein [unclassified Pseudoalteromonas]|uniref:hypothetical protein n=1 Tax=unclassified Pseudoalteromonas TaxID=194690 RepID=UPI001EF045A1|nr:hypothetical protein [Pseudoalteromonas sp. L21]MCF7498951.1 hypothetical protein [Pseudoalteromonas sp. L1]MCF7516603.1 hypothetical protein [Pseudoalteromonas sp. L21]UJX24330.1 hypothetical protein L3Q70_09815 [Pseudoalteromonas sp. CF6-2]WOC24941.1 hypothetical protein LY624_09945 [Pseudoalteromonas sp. N1230-9]
MTLSTLLLSTLSSTALPAQSFDTTKLQGTGGIVIIRKKKQEYQLNGTGGIVIIRKNKKEN